MLPTANYSIPFSLLFNFIIPTAQYPSAWKLVTFVPIHKRSSYSDVANYRPIVILPSLKYSSELFTVTFIRTERETNCYPNVIQVSVKNVPQSHHSSKPHTNFILPITGACLQGLSLWIFPKPLIELFILE